MAKGEPYVVVHGGVHKTATSYVQSILQRNAGRLKKSSVFYIPHRETRKDYTYPCQLNGYEKLGMGFRRSYSDEELKDQAKAFFDNVKAGKDGRIILSDENMAGHCGQCVRTGDLYNRRETLVPIFAKNIPYPVREVHLAVRNYADFFASAYVEFLRSAKGESVFPDTVMKREVLSNLPSWVGLVEVVRGAFPEAQLVLWRHEDFRSLSGRIIGNLCGPGLGFHDLAMPQRSRGRPTASHRAIQVLLAEIARLGGEAGLAKRVEIQEKYPRGPDWPGYDPWSGAERAHLQRVYERDVATIRKTFDLTFLEPDA